MHKISFEPKDSYALWVDGSAGGIKHVDLERCYPAGLPVLDLKQLSKVLEHSPRPRLSPKRSEEKSREQRYLSMQTVGRPDRQLAFYCGRGDDYWLHGGVDNLCANLESG